MEVTKGEAATAEAGGGNKPQNPIFNRNSNPNPNPNPNPSPSHTSKRSKGKSCLGCAYYSSVRKAKSKNPLCVGLPRTVHQAFPYVVEEPELEASKEAYFKYACIGYSVYLDNKDSPADSQDKPAKLPFCVGQKVLFQENSSTSPGGHVPAQAPKAKDNEHATPQPRRYKHPNDLTREDLKRFKKSAVRVASGVAKDMNRVGSYVKDTLDDFLYRRPK